MIDNPVTIADLPTGIWVRHFDGSHSRYRMLPDGLVEVRHDRPDARTAWRRIVAQGVFTLEYHAGAEQEQMRLPTGIKALPYPAPGLDWKGEAVRLRPGLADQPLRLSVQVGPARTAQIGHVVHEMMLVTVTMTGGKLQKREMVGYLTALGIGIFLGDGLRPVGIAGGRPPAAH